MENEKKKISRKDWRFWLFNVVPVVFFIVASVLTITCECFGDKGKYFSELAIVGLIFGVAAIAGFFVGRILKIIKNGGKRNAIASIILSVIALSSCSILTVNAVFVPELVRLQIACDNAYDEMKNVTADDESFEEKRGAYDVAKKNFDKVYKPIDQAKQIIYLVTLAGMMSAYFISQEPTHSSESDDDCKELDNNRT